MATILETLRNSNAETDRLVRLPDGSVRWINHRYFLMSDEDGNPVRLAGMMIDVDGRKRRELENEALLLTGQVLLESLETEAIARAVADILVPDLADWCVVDLVVDDQLASIAIAHVDPAKVRWAKAIRSEYPARLDSPAGVPNVIRTGEPELYPEITDEMLEGAAQDERHLEILRSVGFRSVMIMPLETRKEVIGTATLVMAESQRRFDQESLNFAGRLAPQMAAAIENARLHGRLSEALDNERTAVDTLQRGLTPGPLPDIEGIELAVHYQIGGSHQVGGDWYDIFPIGPRQVAMVIGDVVGRGIQAVASMSQYRNALRAFLIEGHSPEEALRLLHRVASAEPAKEDGFVTVTCLTYHQDSRELVWAAAGHPPALLRRSDGTVERLWQRPDSPVGFGSETYAQEQTKLPPDTLLFLYTDGLIEQRSEDLDVSLERLESELASAPKKPADTVEHLLQNLPSYPSDDDVAILAVLIA